MSIGANSASKTNDVAITSPILPELDFIKRRMARRVGVSVLGLGAAWVRAIPPHLASQARGHETDTARVRDKLSSSVLNPWVEQGIRQVHYQIDDDKHQGHKDNASLDDRVVAVENSLVNPIANARPTKDGLG